MIINITEEESDPSILESYSALLPSSMRENNDEAIGSLLGFFVQNEFKYYGRVSFVERDPKYVLVLFQPTNVFMESVEGVIDVK
jgi:hypothetical protein